MDLLEVIKSQVKEIVEKDKAIGLNSVITHIERSEHFLKKGIDEKDEQYFTDVLYRTNQAYEGILKESFSILTSENGKQKTPYQIEDHFKEKNIFRERVLDLFTNYRKNWRNKSTHNHDLFFSYSEALLAIVSISSFIHVLLIQIQEKISFDIEKESLKMDDNNAQSLIVDYNNLTLIKKVISLLDIFVENSLNFIFNSKEVELIGALSAFFEKYDSSLIIAREPKIGDYLRPDFIIEHGSDKIILEVKKILKQKETVTNQIVGYLEESKIENGIVFFTDPNSKPPLIDSLSMSFESKKSSMKHEVHSYWVTMKNKNDGKH